VGVVQTTDLTAFVVLFHVSVSVETHLELSLRGLSLYSPTLTDPVGAVRFGKNYRPDSIRGAFPRFCQRRKLSWSLSPGL